ncbi:MAG: GNAT family N-acetyltransferase [Rhodobacteraceae bacterium]|nr:GNAT family N-acetyltransferase [Paracoccaceae bacterium]
MISLAPLPRADIGLDFEPSFEIVQHLTLAPGQDRYLHPIADMTHKAPPTDMFHIIRRGAEVVGFFKIDSAFAHAGPNAWGMRGFLVGAQVQGQGIGSSALAALPAYLAVQYPALARLYLTVNSDNAAALHVYKSAGWVQQPEIVADGRSGPQNIFVLELPMHG